MNNLYLIAYTKDKLDIAQKTYDDDFKRNCDISHQFRSLITQMANNLKEGREVILKMSRIPYIKN